jgi:NAD(P)-dependent dehydrogenase (short-subunit alcohol dehydrogenase family)
MQAETLFDITGRAAIVTGASSGLGRHFALTLARAGAKVAIAARRADRLAELAKEIEGFDGRAVPIVLDITDAESVRTAVASAETELGPIAILVNNAGIAATRPALRTDEHDWDRVIDTDLKGAWLVAKEVAAHMIRLGHGGTIINIGSIAGIGAVAQVPAYSAAKAGLHQLTRALAVEWARHDIRVNAIAPGYIETDLNSGFLASAAGQALLKRSPQRRAGMPADLDGVLLLLASDASRFMTGEIVVVDGGHSIAM